MSVVASDIKAYNATTVDDSTNCGGAINASSEIVSGVDNNLFVTITGAEAASGVTKYRKEHRKNTNVSDTWFAPKSWITLQPTTGAEYLAFGVNHADDIRGNMSELANWTAAAKVSLTASGSDTRNCVIYGEVGGVYTAETLALNNTAEVLSSATFDLGKVFAIVPASTTTTTITIKQGSGGATRGTIASGGKICTYFRTGGDIDSKIEGFSHGDIAASGVISLWHKLVIPASSSGGTAIPMRVKTEGIG
jgi:hypothetical protein